MKPEKENLLMKKCKTCYGYGFWAIGRESPMGRIDAAEGYPTTACSDCGANANPVEATQEKK